MAQPINNTRNSKLLIKLLEGNAIFDSVIKNKTTHRLQIIYTEINRDKHNVPSFNCHTYNVNSDTYFYPASTVKMPIAFLALQKLNEINSKAVNKFTEINIDSAMVYQTKVIADATSVNGKASIANYVKKLFMVSDNDANNRLYEFLGQEYINNSLHKIGYDKVQILHRLGVSLSEEENRYTNPILFKDDKSNVIHTQPLVYSKLKYQKRNDFLGIGYYKNNSLINEPFDFSLKNRLCLADLTEILLSVIFPEKLDKNKKFNLKKSDYAFLYRYLSQLPTENKYPLFDSSINYDSYCKFLMYGSNPQTIIPKNIRIFNKIGVAYGFVTDVAYIVDIEKNIEFALSATMHVNEDGIFNDDKYEYEKVAYPFMKNLGQLIYEYELKRERQHKPNLDKFKIKYDE